MQLSIFERIFLNISMLVIFVWGLTRFRSMHFFLMEKRERVYSIVLLSILFGGIGIVATYTGIPVEGAIANARAIGVVSGGILGGPIVGALAGLIAGVHRYVIDVGGFTATACAISTILGGVMGGLVSEPIRYAKHRWIWVGLTTVLAELLQMIIILLMARPLENAWALVWLISVPMILFNSLGVVIFVNLFDSIFTEQNREAAQRTWLALQIANRCLPHMRKGLHNLKGLTKTTEIMLEMSNLSEVAITNTETVLCCAAKRGEAMFPPGGELPESAKHLIRNADINSVTLERHGSCLTVCAPLTQQNDSIIGTLLLTTHRTGWLQTAESEFAKGLAQLFSTQLELSQLDYQKALRRKAELAALQSQINPHFLFNALSTISMFCRTKPERAQELLLALSSYFRNTLRTGRSLIPLQEEMQHVRAYIELEKARFEDKLIIREDIPDDLSCTIPAFTLQPLVENAVKHGAMKQPDGGIVEIFARKDGKDTCITIQDNGKGIPEQIVRSLYEGTIDEHSVGLSNVHKRLKSIYGESYGLYIPPNESSGMVVMRIPEATGLEKTAPQ